MVFDYVITTHQFFPSNYFIKDIPKNRQPIRKKVRELFNQGWGYTKIHKYLLKNGYEVSKHRTSIDCMIKKMKKKLYELNQLRMLNIEQSGFGFKDYKLEITRNTFDDY